MFIESYPKGMAGFRRYIEFLETEPEISDRPEAKIIDEIDGEITFLMYRLATLPIIVPYIKLI